MDSEEMVQLIRIFNNSDIVSAEIFQVIVHYKVL